MKICSRCLAIYTSYLFLPLIYILIPLELNLLILGILLLIPLLIDGFTQLWKWRVSNNFLRVFTGMLFGLGQCILISECSKFIIYIVVQINN